MANTRLDSLESVVTAAGVTVELADGLALLTLGAVSPMINRPLELGGSHLAVTTMAVIMEFIDLMVSE